MPPTTTPPQVTRQHPWIPHQHPPLLARAAPRIPQHPKAIVVGILGGGGEGEGSQRGEGCSTLAPPGIATGCQPGTRG